MSEAMSKVSVAEEGSPMKGSNNTFEIPRTAGCVRVLGLVPRAYSSILVILSPECEILYPPLRL